jgi:hypothetical protein
MNQLDMFAEPIPQWQGGKPQPSGEALKSAGMSAARDAKADAVGYARELALDIARSREDRCCWMYLVNEALAAEGKPGLGNAAGSVFLSSAWEWSGQLAKDPRPHAHANETKIWRL